VIADEKDRRFVDKAPEEEARLWSDFLVQVSPSYATAAPADQLEQQGRITGESSAIFQRPDGKPFTLYRHQEEAIRKVLGGERFVVTNGTGSGKSLCYVLPIADRMIRQANTAERVATLVVYPMNALVNSQYRTLKRLKEQYERRTRKPFPVTFAKYPENERCERNEMHCVLRRFWRPIR
jgi:ATP-dependent helicase YprA (DUF1998 family)